MVFNIKIHYYSLVQIMRRSSPAPSSMGTPTNHLNAAYQHHIQHGPSSIGSPTPSIMSSSSRASSTLRHIKNQSPVIMNTAQSRPVQKAVKQSASAVIQTAPAIAPSPVNNTSENANVMNPSYAKPLTRIQQAPKCSTPPLTTAGANGRPPPPSYEISNQQKVNSPITVPRTNSPAIPQQAGVNKPPPPPYPRYDFT